MQADFTTLTKIFDFTLDELDCNRDGMLSHCQRTMLQASANNWRTEVITPIASSLTLVLLPAAAIAAVYVSFDPVASTMARLAMVVLAIVLLVGITVTALLTTLVLRDNRERMEALLEDSLDNSVRYIHAKMLLDEASDTIYAADVNGAFFFHDAKLDLLPPGQEFIIYCTPHNHKILSVEPYNSDNQRKEPRCLPLRPEGVAPRYETFNKPYVPTVPGKAAV